MQTLTLTIGTGTATFERPQRVAEAHLAYCEDCQRQLGAFPMIDPIFTPSKSKWLHERGTGHTVRLWRLT